MHETATGHIGLFNPFTTHESIHGFFISLLKRKSHKCTPTQHVSTGDMVGALAHNPSHVSIANTCLLNIIDLTIYI